LGEWFRLLKGIGRATAPRHQTLKAAIDWSYDLLSQEERVLMARLSVFAGGCTLEAAEAVCAGGALGEDSVLDLLGRLADKSLITTSADGAEMRYRQLETIRQYGWERLGESDQWEAVIDRYVGWYVELFDRTEGALAGPDAGAWYARFEREHDNLRAVLRYLLRREADRATFLRVCERLWHFWDRGPHLNEARTWFEAGLADTTGVADAELARPLLRAGELAAERGDPATAVARMRRASDLCSRFDRRWQGICLSKLAAVLCKSGRVREGLEVARTCLALARELGASDLTAIACNSVGIALMYVHEYREAEVYFEESLAIAGEPRRAYNSVVKLVHLGLCALLRGDLDRAEKLCDEGLAVWADLGAEFCVAATLATKGYVSLERGSLEEALARFRRSIAMFEQDNARSDLNQLAALAGVACVHAAKGEHRRALRVYGATARLVGEWGAKLPPGIEALHRRYLDLARHAIGDEEADRALAEGSAMNAEQAME
jgi:non-specific serine/threonine protein kinase